MAASPSVVRFKPLLKLRRAYGEDAAELARIFTPARRSMPDVPDIHSAAEDAAFIKGVLLPEHTVWIAELEGVRVGMAAWRDDWLTHLYVHPAHHRRGIGDALLSEAKVQHPKGLQLWVFQSNTPARAFYEARGFRCVELTDGRANEEGCPDARYVWSGKN